MVEPVSAVISVSAKESRIAALSSSNGGSNISSNKSHRELREVKKNDEAMIDTINLSKEVVERTVEALKNYIESAKRSLKIQVHQGTGAIMIKVISEKDGKVIREMPPEELLDLAAKMEELVGTLFNEKA